MNTAQIERDLQTVLACINTEITQFEALRARLMEDIAALQAAFEKTTEAHRSRLRHFQERRDFLIAAKATT